MSDPRNCRVVLLYATWCGGCRSFRPRFAQIARELAARGVDVAELDVDDPANALLIKQHGVRHVPTLLFFAAGCGPVGEEIAIGENVQEVLLQRSSDSSGLQRSIS